MVYSLSRSKNTRKDVLTTIFNLLVQQAQLPGAEAIAVKHTTKDAYQLDASHYVIRSYKSAKYYR